MVKKAEENQSKNEIKDFKKNYLAKNLNSNGSIEYYGVSYNKPNSFYSVMEALIHCNDFERPDGYFYDEKTSTLYIFEHFVFDCSEDKQYCGSTLRRNVNKVNKEIECEIENSSTTYNSVKVISQDDGIQNENTITFDMRADGNKFRNNYIKNFREQYEKHSKKIQDYIAHCIQEIVVTPSKIVTAFVMEDVTMGGTCYKNQNGVRESVNLLFTKQFVETFSGSEIDYVFFGSLQDRILTVCDKSIKNDDLTKYQDLLNIDFDVFPAMFKFTYAVKN